MRNSLSPVQISLKKTDLPINNKEQEVIYKGLLAESINKFK